MKRTISVTAFLLTSLILVSGAHGAVFDDGGSHVIDYSINGNVLIAAAERMLTSRRGLISVGETS